MVGDIISYTYIESDVDNGHRCVILEKRYGYTTSVFSNVDVPLPGYDTKQWYYKIKSIDESEGYFSGGYWNVCHDEPLHLIRRVGKPIRRIKKLEL